MITSKGRRVAGRPYRGFRRPVAVIACLVLAAALLAGAGASGGVSGPALRVLQMNLCNSGEAGCYTGMSVTRAASVLRAHAPDLVTLNEVCEGDVEILGQTLAGVHPDGTVVWAFQPARDRRTGGPYLCQNGQPYGVGLVARLPVPLSGHATDGGIYPVQDPDDPEERAWLCLSAAGTFLVCTTHLAYTSAAVALGQCRYLLDTAVPRQHARSGYQPTLLSGDFNLGTPDLESCLPPDYLRAADSRAQQIIVTPDLAPRSNRMIDLEGTTDHPGLLVSLSTPARV